MDGVTAQLSDLVEFLGATYALAGVLGDPLFEPMDVGLKPVMISTACWRGYVCTYSVREDRLILSELLVGGQSELKGKQLTSDTALFGVAPELFEPWRAFKFQNLEVFVPFSGGLLVGGDVIRSHYVHMGFHPAWKFEHVLELLFKDGVVTEWHDRSSKVAQVRHAIEAGEIDDPDGERGGINWVKKTFSLNYNRTFGSS